MPWERTPHEAWLEVSPPYVNGVLNDLTELVESYGFPRTEVVLGQDHFADIHNDPEEKYLSTNDAFWDGINDGDEVNVHGTDPLDADTDDDGLNDGDEINVHGTNPLDADTDDDTVVDGDDECPLEALEGGLDADRNGCTDTVDGLIEVPRVALREGDRVYVYSDEATLEVRTVKVLRRRPDTVLIREGLEDGERVITSAMPVAVAGMELRTR